MLNLWFPIYDPSVWDIREDQDELIRCFPNNYRPEIDNDVISGVPVDNVGMDVCVNFGDSRSNGYGDIRADFVLHERTGRNLSQ